MEKQINTSEKVNPSTTRNLENIKYTPRKAVKETKNWPSDIMTKEALYCILDFKIIAK
jgi:hypothetical protein